MSSLFTNLKNLQLSPSTPALAASTDGGHPGKPKLHPVRMALTNLILLGWMAYRLRNLFRGDSINLEDLDLMILLPLHSIYSFRAWRRYELGVQEQELNKLFRPITIAPAMIAPPSMQIPAKRLDRVKVAVRRMRGVDTGYR